MQRNHSGHGGVSDQRFPLTAHSSPAVVCCLPSHVLPMTRAWATGLSTPCLVSLSSWVSSATLKVWCAQHSEHVPMDPMLRPDTAGADLVIGHTHPVPFICQKTSGFSHTLTISSKYSNYAQHLTVPVGHLTGYLNSGAPCSNMLFCLLAPSFANTASHPAPSAALVQDGRPTGQGPELS